MGLAVAIDGVDGANWAGAVGWDCGDKTAVSAVPTACRIIIAEGMGWAIPPVGPSGGGMGDGPFDGPFDGDNGRFVTVRLMSATGDWPGADGGSGTGDGYEGATVARPIKLVAAGRLRVGASAPF